MSKSYHRASVEFDDDYVEEDSTVRARKFQEYIRTLKRHKREVKDKDPDT